ncbi:M23 family metallopeptidase [Longispora albida]|uniref:M23 family metallopeptidase n=1 Tax=Longispora albida TaxID=203523 RepID=UPI00037A41E9|nr:M23 family metallopeptidase [Longispora albida]
MLTKVFVATVLALGQATPSPSQLPSPGATPSPRANPSPGPSQRPKSPGRTPAPAASPSLNLVPSTGPSLAPPAPPPPARVPEVLRPSPSLSPSPSPSPSYSEPPADPAMASRGTGVVRAAEAFRHAATLDTRLASAEQQLQRLRSAQDRPIILYQQAAAIPADLRDTWWQARQLTGRGGSDLTPIDESTVAALRGSVLAAHDTATRLAAPFGDVTAARLAEAAQRRDGKLRLPVPGGVTSGFGPRINPLHHGAEEHSGWDLAAEPGTPVLAAAAGRVSRAGWNGSYGYYVCVDHPGVQSCYAHQAVLLVRAGQDVLSGQPVGLSGSTGASTGPHVHFEVRTPRGQALDPLLWM